LNNIKKNYCIIIIFYYIWITNKNEIDIFLKKNENQTDNLTYPLKPFINFLVKYLHFSLSILETNNSIIFSLFSRSILKNKQNLPINHTREVGMEEVVVAALWADGGNLLDIGVNHTNIHHNFFKILLYPPFFYNKLSKCLHITQD